MAETGEILYIDSDKKIKLLPKEIVLFNEEKEYEYDKRTKRIEKGIRNEIIKFSIIFFIMSLSIITFIITNLNNFQNESTFWIILLLGISAILLVYKVTNDDINDYKSIMFPIIITNQRLCISKKGDITIIPLSTIRKIYWSPDYNNILLDVPKNPELIGKDKLLNIYKMKEVLKQNVEVDDKVNKSIVDLD
jgi:hypothetical protein